MSHVRTRSIMGAEWRVSKDKLALVDALFAHGPDDVEMISKRVGTKTPAAVRARIQAYKRTSKLTKDRTPSVNKNVVWPSEMLLVRWMSATAKTYRRTDLATTLRMIARLETHPDPADFNGVDLAGLYSHLAALLDGTQPEKQLDRKNRVFLMRSMCRLYAKVRDSERLGDDVAFLSGVTRIFPEARTVPVEGASQAANALREILSSVAYNPLQIPANMSRLTRDEK